MIGLVVLVIVGVCLYVLNLFIMASSDGDGYAFMGSETGTVVFWMLLAIVLAIVFGSFTI